MRGGVVATVLVGAFAMLGPDAGNAASPVTPDPQQLILRLVDLPPGYRLGNDSAGCPAERGEIELGFDPRYGGRFAYCTIEFRDRHAPSERDPRADTIYSGALTFKTEADAAADYRDHDDLVAYADAVPKESPAPNPPPIGDQTTMYVGKGWNGQTTSLVWRTGRVNSFVAVTAPTAASSYSGALALARRQQERVLSPTPLLPRDNDESEAFLNDPRLGFDVYWLGSSFDPAGSLPQRTLIDADTWGGPGWMGRLIYGGATDLGIWKPRRWVRFKHSKLGQHFLCDRCGKRIRPRLARRRVTIFASRVECLPGKLPPESIAIDGKPKPCKSRKPNLFMAAVRIRDTVVSVNVPVCFTCGNTARDRYNSIRGMRAIAAGLELRVPPN